MQGAFLLILFPLSSCSLDAFLLKGGGRTSDPLASCPSQNRCLPRLFEERDGWTLSDINDRPMRSQALAAAPIGSRGRDRFPGSRAGWAGPPVAAESPALTRPAAALATPGGSGGGAVPLPALLQYARLGNLPPRRSSPPLSSGSGAAHAPGRGTRRWAGRRGEIGPQGRWRWDHGPETRGAGRLQGVLLRQPANKIPTLLLQHALLGESWGSPGNLGCRAPLESEVGCPGLRRGRPGMPGSRRAWWIAMPSFPGCWHFGVIYPGEGHHSGAVSRWGVGAGGRAQGIQ